MATSEQRRAAAKRNGTGHAPSKPILNELGEKIFLDRYALKDMTKQSLVVGDTVIVCVNQKTRQREIGKVVKLSDNRVTVELRDGSVTEQGIEDVDKPLETDPAQMMDRVARGIAAIETVPEKRTEWEQHFRWLLDEWKFVPGGRILTAAGTDQQLTFFNCMPPEQEILTAHGYKPIGEVQIGEQVVTHRNRLRSVLNRFERETVEPLYVIRPKKLGFDDLRVTGEHNVLAIRAEWVNDHRSRDGLRLQQEPQWIPAKDLKLGDFLAVAYNGEAQPVEPIYVSDYLSGYEVRDGALLKPQQRSEYRGQLPAGGTHHDLKDRLVVDADLLYLFGRWLGDGNINHRAQSDIPSGIKIVFNLEERADAEHIARIIEDKFGVTTHLKVSSTERWLDLCANSMALGQFFKAFFGCYSYGKRIPAHLQQLPPELTIALLKGLFTADGYISDNKLGIVLSNRVLATQVHQQLQRLGYLFSIKENTQRLGRQPAYRIQATANECAPLFQDFFGIQAPAHTTDLKYDFEYGGLRWLRITEIAIEDYQGTVLDIEVEDDHSFVSAGVVVSNCYVIPSPQDSRRGIVDTLSQMMEIMSRGGGVGINLSSLRPQHAYVKGVNGRSSGSVSWGGLYSFVTGLIEQGGCFGPDERILTNHGLIPAAELADRLERGEKLLAHTHKGFRPFTHVFRNGIKPLYEVTTRRGNAVRVTLDHKMAVLRGGKITTVALRELREGDEVLLLLGEGVTADYIQLGAPTYAPSIMSTRLNTDLRFPVELNEDLAYLVGYMHGDGYVHVGKKVTWQAPKAIKLATADAYPAIRQRLIDVTRELFGLEPTVEDCGGSAHANVAIYSRMLIEWLTQHGLLKAKAENIRVPEAIFRSPSSVMAAFIAGYFDADGCNRGGKSGYGIDSISLPMLRDVQQLLAINGIVSAIHTTDRTHLGWQTIHRLNVTGGSFRQRFAELVPSAKISADHNGKRDVYQTYPADVWTSMGARSKYRQRIYDGVSPRISFGQLTSIGERLAVAGEVAVLEAIADVQRTLPDAIESIVPVGNSPVYDFEVDDVHLLSGNGIYTSNSRRGALMLILNVWHPDVIGFINSKREMGKITNANISVGLTDAFMEAVQNDADWPLVFPDPQHPDYNETWDGDIEKWRAAGKPVNVYKTIKARELWNNIIESAWASAEPGLWFMDRANKMSNSWYFSQLICTNPCTTGDTLVSTEHGYIRARDLKVGMKIRTPAGLKPIEKVYNNGVQRIYRIEFSDGGFLECTADHKLKVVRDKKYEWIATTDLRQGDRVVVSANETFGPRSTLPVEAKEYIQKRNLNVADYYDRRLGFVTGVVLGDGVLKRVPIRNSHSYQCRIAFGAHEEAWEEHFVSTMSDMGIHTHRVLVEKEIDAGDGTLVVHQAVRRECYKLATLLAKLGVTTNVKGPQKTIPEPFMGMEKEFVAGLLDGLFSTDGSVSMKQDNPMLRFHTSSYELAQQVRLLLLQFGIHGRIYRATRDEDLTYDGRSMYGTGEKYDVLIMNEGIARFYAEIGLSHPEKAARLKDIAENWHFIGGTWTASVLSVQDTEREEEVFDVYEPNTLTWITNGYVSFDCGEQPLPAWGICNLGAINLGKFVQDSEVQWDDLRQAVRYAVRFLDNVIDATPYFFDENQQQQQNERRVGLGIMGLADMLIRLGIRYGSDECITFLDQLGEVIATEAYFASADNAAEKGAFPMFDAEKLLQSGYMQAMPEPVREAVRQKGLRNVTLLTVAPTGTTGTMVATSTGVEPYFSWSYFRKSRLGIHEEKVAVVEEWQQANPGQPLPEFFVNAMELAPKEHVNVQAVIQRWVDSAISKTANLPNDYTVEQTRDLYEYMYKMGCKGGTIYRDGSRDEQVLNLKKEEEKKPEAQPAAESSKPTLADLWKQPKIRPRPRVSRGSTIKQTSPLGSIYVTVNNDDENEPLEIFVTAGKAGSDVTSMADALGRLASLVLRVASPVTPHERIREIIDQLRGIGGARSTGFGPNRVRSLPDAVAQALEECYAPASTQVTEPEAEDSEPRQVQLALPAMRADLCPSCGEAAFIHEEGCMHCNACGYSQC